MQRCGYLKLNVGSGNNSKEDCVNVDKIRLPSTNVVWDLEKTPLPFKTNSVSEIMCDHVLEHIHNFLPLMNELYRICKKNAKILITVPYYKYEGAYRDPTHVRFFTERSFDYFKEDFEYNYYSKARFNIRKIKLRTTSKTSVKTLQKRVMRFIPLKGLLNPFFWNLYSEVYFELEVVK